MPSSAAQNAAANLRLGREFFASLGSVERDKATFRRLCSPDFVWENSGLPAVQGHEAACAMVDAWAAQIDFDSVDIEMLHIVADGDTVLCERIDTMYDSRRQVLFTLPIVGRLKIAGGKIVAYRDYFDPTEVRRKFAV